MGGKGKHNKKHHNHRANNRKQNEYIQKQPPINEQQLLFQCLEVNQLLSKRANQLKKMKTGELCHILSKKWLHDWKQYVGYEWFTKQQQQMNRPKSFGKKYPGCINYNLIDNNDKYYEIPANLPQYQYLNNVIKAKMSKDDDYIAVTPAIWQILSNKYQANAILRPIRILKSGNFYYDGQVLNCEIILVYLTQINNMPPYKKIQLSNLWQFEDLQQFFQLFCKVVFNEQKITLWKGSSYLSSYQLQEKIAECVKKQNYEISAELMTSDKYKSLDLDEFLKQTHTIIVEIGQTIFKPADRPDKITGFCEQCIHKKMLHVSCICMEVYYCSMECRSVDQSFHYNSCKQAFDSEDDQELQMMQVQQNRNTGLVNIGNTCYMNSSIQCLMSVVEFRQFFTNNNYLKQLDKKQLDENGGIFVKKWSKLCKIMSIDKNASETWNLKGQINHFMQPFKGFKQHDANDFLTNFINTINEFLQKEEQNAYHSLFRQLFMGQFQSLVICPVCTVEITNLEMYMQITLPIKTKIKQSYYNYVIVDSNSVTKGKAQIKNNWTQLINSLGIKEPCMIRIGQQGENSIEIDYNSSPFKIIDKIRKDVIFYPGIKIEFEENYLMMNLISAKEVCSMRMKSPYGYPLPIIFNPKINSLVHLWVKIIQQFFPQQIYQQAESIKSNYYKALKQYFQSTTTNHEQQMSKIQQKQEQIIQTNQKVPEIDKDEKQTKNDRNIENNKNKKKNKNQKNIKEQYDKNDEDITEQYNNKFQQLMNKLQIIVFVDYYKRKKGICHFCNKRCSGCFLPIKMDVLISQYFDDKIHQCKVQVQLKQKYQTQIQKKNFIQSADCKLEECFQLFKERQQLDQENAWYCDICDMMRLAYKQIKINTYPKILILHLNRFKNQDGIKSKNSEPIEYNQIQYFGNKPYSLIGAIIHEGSMQGGHYWAICRRQQKYYIFNDQKVCETKNICNKNAYILFYRQIN